MGTRTACLELVLAVLAALPATLAAQTAPSAPPATPIMGFMPAHAVAEHRLEDRFRSLPSAEAARSWHRGVHEGSVPSGICGK
jgi:hypothetical protein